MSPLLKYTLARLGLFAAVAVVLLALPTGLHPLLVLGIAVLASALLSLVLLRGTRDQVAIQVAAAVDRRAERRRRLQAALAGTPEEAGSPEEAGAPEEARAPDGARASDAAGEIDQEREPRS